MKEDERFIRTYRQSSGLKNTGSMEIWVDKKTGVNYLYHEVGYSGGLTVMLDTDGKPVVTKVDNIQQ